MTSNRWDETWHRLRQWTNGQAQSERLAAQILISEGFTGINPSHPLGGKDGGTDAVAKIGDKTFMMAVYFPHGQIRFSNIKKKFLNDFRYCKVRGFEGIAFVTNQELTLGQRKEISKLGEVDSTEIEIYHLERITVILDNPSMAGIREQFLNISVENPAVIQLGGQGGMAPGAGGGGGGAIGLGARGRWR